MKKILTIGVSAICMLLLVTGCNDTSKPNEGGNNTQEGGIQTNTNDKVIGDKTIDNLTISNVSLVRENGETKILLTVTNKTTSKISHEFIKATYKNADGTTLASATMLLGDLEAGASKEVTSNTYVDLMKAADVEYEFK